MAQFGRASRCQREGRGFKSRCVLFGTGWLALPIQPGRPESRPRQGNLVNWVVGQLVLALQCRYPPPKLSLAEHGSCKAEVVGSIPTGGSRAPGTVTRVARRASTRHLESDGVCSLPWLGPLAQWTRAWRFYRQRRGFESSTGHLRMPYGAGQGVPWPGNRTSAGEDTGKHKQSGP